ncbi:hypothetical protein BRADI_4g10165v3 [Brachypodium distachyon]|uniref:Uncharacterized protein n=1 Tax=Brachypodium distachyon TaxID=15368 RepID=A0A0Q3H1N3_BRADI|nr:hypothetical protein BRADI_4g10165v3 [Brachypodium distachyon]
MTETGFSVPRLSPRWQIKFSAVISSSRLRILDGILEYHAGAGQLLLRDSVGRIVRTGGFSYDGGTVSFPFHVVHGTGKPVLVADSSASCGANGSTSTGSRVRAPEVRVIGVIPTRSDEPGLLGPPPGKPVRHVDTTSTNSRGINGGSIPGTRVPRGGMGIDNTPSDLGLHKGGDDVLLQEGARKLVANAQMLMRNFNEGTSATESMVVPYLPIP